MKHAPWLKLIFGCLIAFAVTASYAADPQPQAAFTPAQEARVETIIHDYLIKNPQVLAEAAKAYQQQQQARIQERAKQIAQANGQSLFASPYSPVAGNLQGDVTLVAFMDYQCPYCKRIAPVIARLMKTDPNLRVVYKELPIFGATSQFAAQAGLAAQQQGKYLIFHRALLQIKAPLTEAIIIDTAKSVGLNTKKLKADMITPAVNEQLQENLHLANQLGIVGTPSFVIASNPFTESGKVFFVPGAANESVLRNFIAEARRK